MKIRSLLAIIVLVLAASLLLAQQPRPLQRRPVQRQMQNKNFSVVDLRTAKPLVARVQVASKTGKPVVPPGAARSVSQALSVAQVKASLAEAGINDVSPSGAYALFTPTQLSAGSKGFMLLQAPLWVDANEIQFDTALDQNEFYDLMSGPKVRLLEAGTYVLDFQLDIPAADPNQAFRCDVYRGDELLQQINFSEDSQAAHHILVVFQQAASSPQNPWIAIAIHSKDYVSGLDWVRWHLAQVAVTKL
jgi:hypothetical protein